MGIDWILLIGISVVAISFFSMLPKFIEMIKDQYR